MLKPINGFLIIEPLKRDSFISSDNKNYQEVGVVLAVPEVTLSPKGWDGLVGKRVYFDAWLAGKYPKENGEYFWLVRYDDIKAIEEI